MVPVVDFVPTDVLKRFNPEQRAEFIIDRTKQGRILLLEMGLTPEERLVLMQKAMEHYDETFIGIKLRELSVRTRSAGLIRQKEIVSNILLVAPGDAEITLKDQGILSVGIAV
ncbi:MAG: DUF2073 domain-containing protein [Methanobacteriota archaeon]|nr:MAG: DUF2073 domain-containing protein [Euryarchaeota archaeon]